jgi:hypothetical protein
MTILPANAPPLVANNERIEAKYRNTERDLCMAGVEAKIFETQHAATRWLDGGGTSP